MTPGIPFRGRGGIGSRAEEAGPFLPASAAAGVLSSWTAITLCRGHLCIVLYPRDTASCLSSSGNPASGLCFPDTSAHTVLPPERSSLQSFITMRYSIEHAERHKGSMRCADDDLREDEGSRQHARPAGPERPSWLPRSSEHSPDKSRPVGRLNKKLKAKADKKHRKSKKDKQHKEKRRRVKEHEALIEAQ